MPPPTDPPAADWLRPPEEQEGLSRYVETLRERLSLIVLCVAVTTGVALLYVLSAAKTYEAETDLLITPVTGDDPVLTSLGLIRESVDPTRDVETASRLVTNIEVAERVQAVLHSPETAQALLEKVSAEPVAQSNIVAVVATEASPAGAQRLADAFAEQAVAARTEKLHEQAAQQLTRLRELEGPRSSRTGQTAISSRIAQLEAFRSGADPTMRVEVPAPLPTSQASPKPALSVAAGILAGLILGIGGAFASQALDPRLRRESQLRRLYRVPILARVPRERRKGAENPLAPGSTSTVASEAYRTLSATLSQAGPGRVIMLTGSSASEGKTTSAIHLATSLALAGKRVILIESDLRRPVMSKALGVTPARGGVVGVLIESQTLPNALLPTSTYGPNLQILLAEYEGGWIADLFSLPAAERLIHDARQMADYVVIDSPPLNEVVDALPLARYADDVLIVVRLGATRLQKLAQLGELLAENGIRPTGFVVVGTPKPSRSEYHYHADSPLIASENGHSMGAALGAGRGG
ncbi:MAG TPA: AAA family ATPase [Solirubrobacterales bacterium]|nr:AAA family ATPase [Solirubrobacterales bacterium]